MLRPITVLLLLVLALAICSAAPATSAASPTPVVRLGTIAGSPFQLGSADGVGSAARFTFPRGIAISPDETFALVADTDNHTIRHITLATARSPPSPAARAARQHRWDRYRRPLQRAALGHPQPRRQLCLDCRLHQPDHPPP